MAKISQFRSQFTSSPGQITITRVSLAY